MSIMYKTKMLIQLCHLLMLLRKIHPLIICNIPILHGLPLDIVHDILEGFATDFLQKRLSYFMHLEAFESLDTRNGKCINKYLQLFSC